MSVTINLSWTPGAGGGTVQGYKIWRLAGGDENDTEAQVMAGQQLEDGNNNLGNAEFGTNGSQITYADSNALVAGETYSYVLQASNTSGDSASATATDGGTATVATVTTV